MGVLKIVGGGSRLAASGLGNLTVGCGSETPGLLSQHHIVSVSSPSSIGLNRSDLKTVLKVSISILAGWEATWTNRCCICHLHATFILQPQRRSISPAIQLLSVTNPRIKALLVTYHTLDDKDAGNS